MEDTKYKIYRSRHDSLINKVFWNGNRVIRVNFISKHPNISEYLLSRYQDSDSYRETIQRIKLGIEEKPKCPTCGKPVNFIGKQKKMFSKYCCNSCRARNKETHIKANQTYFKRTGYTHNSRNPESQERIKQTCQKRYGANSVVESYKGKEGRIKSFGKLSFFQTDKFKEKMKNVWHLEDFKNKIIDGFIKKYGIEWYVKSEEYKHYMDPIWKSDEFKEKFKSNMKRGMLEKYGVISFPKAEEYKIIKDKILEKKYNTMKKNNTFNTSKPEEELYVYIKSKFPSVIRQYKDKERYPWQCDFYIPELDYFIELNGTWTHGKHPYNPNSEDKALLEKMQAKALSGHKYYLNAIKTWTIYDVNKRETAKRNNLNFKEVWSLQEGKEFIDDLYEKREIP